MTAPKIKTVDITGKAGSAVAAFPTLEGFEPRAKLLTEVVRSEMSNLRQGNAHTKTRGEVRGGGRKPWKQKGTGRARHGSIRSPIWVGGGVTFGPRSIRNWHLKINKSARLSALKSVMSDKIIDGNIYLLKDGFKFDKTKSGAEFGSAVAKAKEVKDNRIMVVYTTEEKESVQGLRNTNVKMQNVTCLKIKDMIQAHTLVLTPAAKTALEARFEK